MKRVDHSYGRQKSGESQDIKIDLWFCMVQYGSFLARDIVPVAGAARNTKTHLSSLGTADYVLSFEVSASYVA